MIIIDDAVVLVATAAQSAGILPCRHVLLTSTSQIHRFVCQWLLLRTERITQPGFRDVTRCVRCNEVAPSDCKSMITGLVLQIRLRELQLLSQRMLILNCSIRRMIGYSVCEQLLIEDKY